MIDFLRNFIGYLPDFSSVYDFPDLLEYIFAFILLMVVILSIYSVLGNIINILRK